MSSTSLLPNLDLAPGTPPILHAKSVDDPASWAAEHHDPLHALVLEHGSVLVRGLGLADPATSEAVFRRLTGRLMADREPFAPRRRYADGVYSSTKWPPNQQMCMHHELSYGLEFPGLLLYACLEAPGSGGATALADASAVLRDLPRDLVSRFEREGWLLTRAYHEEIGASVEEAFGTGDREAVERYCRRHSIEFAWQADGSLHTRQRRGALLRHPSSGLPCWFNQIAFLNEWTMEPEVHEYLVEMYGADGLPFNTRFGDGGSIDAEIVRTINEVYDTHTVREPWQDGDLLLVDNIRTAHSREPFEGPREVLAALGNPVLRADGEVSGV